MPHPLSSLRALVVISAIALVAAGAVGTVPIGMFSQGEPGALPDEWEPMKLGKTDPSRYELVQSDGITVLKASADDSASGLVRRMTLDPQRYPVLEWSWKVENVISKGHIDTKSGDDYPARLYITFDYDPGNLSFGERMKYEAIQAFGGGDVPLRALNYVWSNHADETSIRPNPFTDWVMMVPVQSGSADVGEWQTERRNIYEDYRRAFGEEPPAISGIAVMTDGDNTASTATAYYGDIVLKSE